MRPRSVAAVVAAIAAAGCATATERFAARISCDPAATRITETRSYPGYSETAGTCEGTRYVCRDAPFYSTCEPEPEDQPDKSRTR